MHYTLLLLEDTAGLDMDVMSFDVRLFGGLGLDV